MSKALDVRRYQSGDMYICIWKGRYIFTGGTSEHSLNVADTNKARLESHWEGYVANNGE